MEKDFDYARLESNLGLEMLAVFEKKTGIAPAQSTPWFDHIADSHETIGIYWLKSEISRTPEGLIEHMWPLACELALMPADDRGDYEEFTEEIHEALGLCDGTFNDSLFPSALVDIARALGALDDEDALIYAFAAERLVGIIINSNFERSDGETTAQALRALGKAGADARHRENRDMKAEAIRHFLENRPSFSSKDEAAQIISTNIVPVKFGTVRKWLVEKKDV